MSTETSQTPTNAAAYMIDQHIAATRGDRLALRYGDKKYSYHDLAALMNRAGNMFRGLSVDRGDRILLLLTPSPALFASVLGAMKIGAVPIVIPGRPDGRVIQSALAETKPRVIVAHESELELIADLENGSEGSAEIVVVGQNSHGYASFLELIRSAASSLAGVTMSSEETALGIMEDGALLSVSHQELHDFLASPELDGPLKELDIALTLAAFAQCNEAALAA